MRDEQDSSSPRGVLERRALLRAGCAFALAAAAHARADEVAEGAPRSEEALASPQENDLLVFAFGPRTGHVIAPGDLVAGAKQTLAYPMAPVTRRVRDGTRLNQLIVTRVAAERLLGDTAARSAGGVVAYSGVCTHTGCDVT